MCNHYRVRSDMAAIAARIRNAHLACTPAAPAPEHIYPKYPAPIVLQQNGERSIVEMRWGITRFIGQGKTKQVTNARNDKLLGRTWQKSTETRRCLIPAAGYFEPGLGPPGAKGEILFRVKERPIFFIAGLWDEESGGRTFTMVTTEPNDYVRTYHDRMPVVLDDADLETWLGEAPLPLDRLETLCRGLPSEALEHEELAPRAKLTRPATPAPAAPSAQLDLFS